MKDVVRFILVQSMRWLRLVVLLLILVLKVRNTSHSGHIYRERDRDLHRLIFQYNRIQIVLLLNGARARVLNPFPCPFLKIKK